MPLNIDDVISNWLPTRDHPASEGRAKLETEAKAILAERGFAGEVGHMTASDLMTVILFNRLEEL